MTKKTSHALLGGILGFSPVLGTLVFRAALSQRNRFEPWFREEWGHYGALYKSMAASTVGAFAVFGLLLGKRSDAMQTESRANQYSIDSLNLLAMTDGLTGVYNHRHLHERLAAEVERAERYKNSFVCLMLDIDNFKHINDKHGHPFGDLVLVTIARILRENVRRIDTVGRYGGEEFLVIMPNTTIEGALRIAERIRAAVEKYPFSLKQEEVPVTVSAGLTNFSSAQDVRDKSSLLRATDDALFQAKREGKNRVVVWDKNAASAAKEGHSL